MNPKLLDDIYDLIENHINYPFPDRCVHAVALDLLQLIETYGQTVSSYLADAIIYGKDDDARRILAERKHL